jgi:pyridoxal 5'-phosphate synthase pdxT subunit
VTVAGVLALQGDFEAHARMLRSAGAADVRQVRTLGDLLAVEALVIPGGESTTIGMLLEDHELIDPLRKRIEGGLPVLGTCAGMIVLARTISDPAVVRGREQPVVGAIDIVVRRNAYGRQVDSFETDLSVDGFDRPLHAVFIRAPAVEEAGSRVEVLARYDGRPVVVRQGSVLLAAFHPEIAGDDRLHRLFLEGS